MSLPWQAALNPRGILLAVCFFSSSIILRPLLYTIFYFFPAFYHSRQSDSGIDWKVTQNEYKTHQATQYKKNSYFPTPLPFPFSSWVNWPFNARFVPLYCVLWVSPWSDRIIRKRDVHISYGWSCKCTTSLLYQTKHKTCVPNPIKPHENPWKPVKTPSNPIQTPSNPMKAHQIPFKPHQTPWKPMKTHENPWKPMKTHENPWKPMKTHENPSNSSKHDHFYSGNQLRSS